jgi:hypothetical protein
VFSSEKDRRIIEMRADGVSWKAIAAKLGIPGTACNPGGYRVRRRYVDTLDPNIVSGAFSLEEDATIIAAVETAGGVDKIVWEQLGRDMGRPGNSVRQHFSRALAKN